ISNAGPNAHKKENDSRQQDPECVRRRGRPRREKEGSAHESRKNREEQLTLLESAMLSEGPRQCPHDKVCGDRSKLKAVNDGRAETCEGPEKQKYRKVKACPRYCPPHPSLSHHTKRLRK